jgi:hypothetical protein
VFEADAELGGFELEALDAGHGASDVVTGPLRVGAFTGFAFAGGAELGVEDAGAFDCGGGKGAGAVEEGSVRGFPRLEGGHVHFPGGLCGRDSGGGALRGRKRVAEDPDRPLVPRGLFLGCHCAPLQLHHIACASPGGGLLGARLGFGRSEGGAHVRPRLVPLHPGGPSPFPLFPAMPLLPPFVLIPVPCRERARQGCRQRRKKGHAARLSAVGSL